MYSLEHIILYCTLLYWNIGVHTCQYIIIYIVHIHTCQYIHVIHTYIHIYYVYFDSHWSHINYIVYY